jgi:hypothetical protein
MSDLVSLFRNFIYRDLAFILGGSIVVLSFLHAFGVSLHKLQDQPYTLFLLTVLAYVVGYTVQDLVALLPWRPTFTGDPAGFRAFYIGVLQARDGSLLRLPEVKKRHFDPQYVCTNPKQFPDLF